MPAEKIVRRPAPADIAVTLRAELPALTDEILEEAGRWIPGLARPEPGHDARLRAAVETGVARFADRLTGIDRVREPCPYRELGEWEQRAGRELTDLQALFRLGARILWRRLSQIGPDAVSTRTMWRLGEELFGHVEEIAALVVAGHTEAALRAGAAGDVQRRRRQLVELLLTGPEGSTGERFLALAAEARWRLPRTVACVTLDCRWRRTHAISPAVTADVLMDLDRPEPCLVVPDPDGPGRADMLERALKGMLAAVGPVVPLADAVLSFRLSRQTLWLAGEGSTGLIHAGDHLPALLVQGNEEIVEVMRDHLYAPMAGLSPGQRRRLCETLLVWLTTGGSARQVGERLAVHAQTIRYRMRRLEELFGARLHDPTWRLSMAITLFRDRPDRGLE